MIDYTNNVIVQILKQYDMLANSLTIISDCNQRENIYYELNKLENKIIFETNKIYETEYNKLNTKIVTDIDEEKERLNSLIQLINNHTKNLEDKKNKHHMITGLFVDIPSFIGENQVSELENKIEIIDKYNSNLNLIKKYTNEITSIEEKLLLANEKINISNSLNNELEVKLKKMVEDSFNQLDLYRIRDERDEVEKIYKELKYILSIAEENIKITNTLSYNVDFDEQSQFEEVEEAYLKYKEKKTILELLDIYDKRTKTYEELIEKRKQISDIINEIPNSSIYLSLIGELREQFDTLKKEQEDINTLNSLQEEKESKENLILQIKTENNSEIFQSIIRELVSKEERLREEKLLEQKKTEEEKKHQIIMEEENRKEEIKRRQKLIEEMRKKDMEERAKQLLEEKQKSDIQQNQNILEEKGQLLTNDKDSNDKILNNPIFQDIKHEITDEQSINNEKKYDDNYFVENNNVVEEKNEKIINALPSDLDEYIKKFDAKDANVFKDDQIFIDY